MAFVPRQNPFYVALPYNDVTRGRFKPEARLVIPWFKQAYTEPGRSVCKSRWLAIRKGNRTAYAQWEDCGPFRTDPYTDPTQHYGTLRQLVQAGPAGYPDVVNKIKAANLRGMGGAGTPVVGAPHSGQVPPLGFPRRS